METIKSVTEALSFLLTVTSFAILLTTPTPQGVKDGSVVRMALQLSFDKEQYHVGDLITIYVDYKNFNLYPVTFKPPSNFIIEYNYGQRAGEYPVVMYGWSVSPPEMVGRSYTIAAQGVYHLTSFELDAEKSGSLFISSLGYVKTVRIMEK